MTAYFRLRVTLNKCCTTAVLAKPRDEFRALENRGSIFCVLAVESPILSEHVNRPSNRDLLHNDEDAPIDISHSRLSQELYDSADIQKQRVAWLVINRDYAH
jgi:hypothetical protein